MLPQPTVVVTLPDGRALAADDVGDPGGVPVLYLHGAPDCRLARHPDDSVARGAGVRLLAVDRPGYGGTDPQAGAPDVGAWGDDVGALLDAVGVERCRVVAWSAGGSWALGLAAALPGRVERVVTYAALAPFEALDDEAAAAASGPRRDIAEGLAAGGAVEAFADDFVAMLVPPPPVDIDVARELLLETYGDRARRELGSVDGAVETMARSLVAAVDRHGGAGMHADVVVQFTPGLPDSLAAIACDVVLVHGERDPIAGPAVGEWLAARLAHATVEVWPDAGHHALFPRWRDLLDLAAR